MITKYDIGTYPANGKRSRSLDERNLSLSKRVATFTATQTCVRWAASVFTRFGAHTYEALLESLIKEKANYMGNGGIFFARGQSCLRC